MDPMLLAIGALIVLSGIGILVRFSGMRPYLSNILIPCCLIALSLVFLAITFRFSGEEEAGPAAIPRLWISLILILSSIILGQILRGKDKDEVVPRIKRRGLLALVMVTLISYFLAISYIGYFLSSFLFIVLLLNMLTYRKKLLFIVLDAGSSWGVHRILHR